MMDVYTKCSRCGEPTEGDSCHDAPCFESVKFLQVTTSGCSYIAINRDNKEEQGAFRQEYPLCPDCLADTLDFVRGRYRMITHEDVREVEQ